MKRQNNKQKTVDKIKYDSNKPYFEEYEPTTETSPLEEFILEVIERRGELEISQEELADLLGTTQSVISRFENLGRKPGYDFIKRVTEKLGGELLITLNGDYTLVVPMELRKKVDELASKEGFNTKEFLNYLLRESLENWEKWH
ncbi:MAG: helix-turn-helix domain-containing protein [Kosmotogaceae bacterium]